jgi:hypothetical protein
MLPKGSNTICWPVQKISVNPLYKVIFLKHSCSVQKSKFCAFPSTVEYLWLPEGQPDMPFSQIFFAYSVMGLPKKVRICCGGKAGRACAKKQGVKFHPGLPQKQYFSVTVKV